VTRRPLQALLLSASLGLVAPAPLDARQTERSDAALEARLGALDPARPMEYFELAEEVADAGGKPGVALARRLYALAWETAHRSGDAALEARLGASVCIALADLSGSDAERRWLFALCRSVGGAPRDDQSLASWEGEGDGLAIAEVLGAYRAGETLRARAALDASGRRERLLRLDEALRGRAAGIVRAIETTSLCPECRNRRAVRIAGDSGQAWRLCSTCKGNPGPALSRQELLDLLRAEAVALDARPRDWSESLLVDPSPALEVDLAEIARRLKVDPEATVWRDGDWRKPGP
jgi:hypothetical protein